ncbi:unnamed protein product [Caenorhabditis auriculariae]|uniref:G-protein coupled receptors family 1 profile domain-containing protein n=1 Tax=Caenorhabditis auriculariae TaxID=2777116 RepID=A0A8S1HY20_9PELO|nr:unnamed protein product [Caenorhabditis auriculariae]
MSVDEGMSTSPADDVAADSAEHLYLVVLPIIAFSGIIGNIISLVTIFHSRLRRVNANTYLIVLTAADSIFLLAVLLIYYQVDYIAYKYCVSLEYVLMVASYVSSWSTAALTIERYLAIAHPLTHMKYGHVDRTKIMFYWVPIPFVLNLFQFFALKESTIEGERKCALKEANYQIFAQVADTFLCYVVPCAIIVVLNLLVVVKVRKSQQCFQNESKNNSRRQGGTSGQSGTWTRILWVMPLVFVVLNTPFYVLSMIEIVIQVVYESPSSMTNRSELFVKAYNYAHYMYYCNTAIDVFVYAFSSANFRKTVVIAWTRIFYTVLQPCYGKPPAKVILTDQTSRYSYRMTSIDGSKRASSPNPTAPLLDTEVQQANKTLLTTAI